MPSPTSVRPLILILTLSLTAFPTHGQDAAPGAPPEWYLEHNEFLTRDGGIFHTDNSAYKSEGEPWEAYGLAWEKGPSGLAVRGRLFGLRDGRDAGTFWEFFVYWHPAEGRAYMMQIGGGGALGVGTLEPPREDGSHRSEQTFHSPAGDVTRVAHEIRNQGDVHDTRSFDWAEGEWTPRRHYVWHRVQVEQALRKENDQGSDRRYR
jgi:hypothetical protein